MILLIDNYPNEYCTDSCGSWTFATDELIIIFNSFKNSDWSFLSSILYIIFNVIYILFKISKYNWNKKINK